MADSWEKLSKDVISCHRCQRLVDWRERVAREKRRAYMECDYWGKPVPGFGDEQSEVLVLGLAPGAHGSNRTGRMFTGDASGDFLFPALHQAGFCSQAESYNRNDGLTMKNMFITAVCRCAPPGNKPTREEQLNCREFLLREIDLFKDLKIIVALGSIAHNNAFDVMKLLNPEISEKRPKFGHGNEYSHHSDCFYLVDSYHPSRQNTQTGRLTREMFAQIWERTNQLLDTLPKP